MAESSVNFRDLLGEESIHLDQRATDRFDAVRQCGEALVAAGAVDASYLESMAERERSVSTYVGGGVAIPHGTSAGKESIQRDALVFLQFPDGIEWDGNRVEVCVGIAAAGGSHIALLSRLAEVLLDPERARQLRGATSANTVYEILESTPAED